MTLPFQQDPMTSLSYSLANAKPKQLRKQILCWWQRMFDNWSHHSFPQSTLNLLEVSCTSWSCLDNKVLSKQDWITFSNGMLGKCKTQKLSKTDSLLKHCWQKIYYKMIYWFERYQNSFFLECKSFQADNRSVGKIPIWTSLQTFRSQTLKHVK